jgi:spore maturation protein CgeB
MRVAVVGTGRWYKSEASIARASRSLGHDTILVDVPRWSRLLGPAARPLIQRRIERFRPDQIIATARVARLGEEGLERLARRFPTAFWYFDPIFTPEAVGLASRCSAAYVTYTHHFGVLPPGKGPPMRFLPQGVDPLLDRPPSRVPSRFKCEVSFIGSGQYPLRHDALRQVGGVAALQIRGPGWDGVARDLPVAGGDIRGKSFAEAVAGAAISLGLAAHREQQTARESSSNRLWKVLGVGGFYLGEYAPGLEGFARDREHCAWFHSSEELLELVRHYLAHPEERQRIATRGRAHALAHHTYAHRMELLLAGRGYAVTEPIGRGG